MTVSQLSRKEERKQGNSAYDTCTYCGQEIHEQDWFRDEEGLTHCDEDCGKFHREEVTEK